MHSETVPTEIEFSHEDRDIKWLLSNDRKSLDDTIFLAHLEKKIGTNSADLSVMSSF